MILNEIGEGRWLTPDLLGGDITNPQSLNRYSYALNNPTTLTDPSGLDPSDCTAGMDDNGNPIVNCSGSDTVTVNGGEPPSLGLIMCELGFGGCGQTTITGPVTGYGQSGGGGGGGGAPAPRPAPPKPDVPLNAFATAVFSRVGCETQFLDRLPGISGGGFFGFAGVQPQLPVVPVKGDILGIANYDSRGGLSTGFLIGATGAGSGPGRFLGAGVETAYNWQSHSWTNEGLGFFGAETEGLNVGAAGAGFFFGDKGAVGVYGEIGPFGGGGYLNLSYPGCSAGG